MKQKKLYRALDTVASQHFDTEKELLIEILTQVVENYHIHITGGRLWQLNVQNECYDLLYQIGNVEKIDSSFVLSLRENPIFEKVTAERTILANETNHYLIEKGIFKYSASGVGDKKKVGGKRFYEYIFAVNSEEVNEDLYYSLNIVATILTSKINDNRHKDSQREINYDIDEAKKLQKSILPEHERIFNGYSLFGVTIPAKTMSGDFFDYLNFGSESDRLGIIVGDAASKGISAAAEAMYITGAIRMAVNFEIKISALLTKLNKIINKIFTDDRFTTLFYGEISNDEKGLFLYGNAGHNAPLFYSVSKKEIKYLHSTGPLLGPAPNSKYKTDSINIEIGDVLVIYSDGIVEAADTNFDFYEEKRLEKLIIENCHLSPKDLTLTILDDVNKFATNGMYSDDKTIVVVKRLS
ncbi:MAG: serine/threonine-protein phosphatase [Bacteroidetes bacterium]|nr:serine/threonine-protein phosphatase [Bacteroidota bacterium]MBU1113846.1 serine/threonine-protein phosphatase [Bacteroidota bacterium]MBU1799662.1 serine/threonine-protein phosphatase [Bacteroidota bacterium]